MAMKRQRETEATAESLDFANSLILLSQARELSKPTSDQVFECKTCNRKFSSFQALGGHRASHKKPKLDVKAVAKSLSLGNKPKMHECSICGLEFSLGQALGGHMRKHRDIINQGISSTSSIHQLNQIAAKVPVLKRSNSKRISLMDLNLTPLENDLKLLFGERAPQVQLSLM